MANVNTFFSQYNICFRQLTAFSETTLVQSCTKPVVGRYFLIKKLPVQGTELDLSMCEVEVHAFPGEYRVHRRQPAPVTNRMRLIR